MLATSIDRRILYVGDSQGVVYRLATSSPAAMLEPMARHAGEVTALAVSADGKLVASAHGAETKVWDATSGDLVQTLPTRRQAVRGLAFASDSRRVVVAGDDHHVQVYDSRTGTLRWDADHGDAVVALTSSSADVIATSDRSRRIRLWSYDGKLPLATLTGHDDDATTLAFTDDGTQLYSGSSDETIRRWDVARHIGSNAPASPTASPTSGSTSTAG